MFVMWKTESTTGTTGWKLLRNSFLFNMKRHFQIMSVGGRIWPPKDDHSLVPGPCVCVTYMVTGTLQM